ncbi:MAG: hypothetical protein JXR70_13815 [Spirochaetales bacterium]|nr:hypothetical protein [Spirochaetales bacterium]
MIKLNFKNPIRLVLVFFVLVFAFSCTGKSDNNAGLNSSAEPTDIVKPEITNPPRQGEAVELTLGTDFNDSAKGIAICDDGGVLLAGKTQTKEKGPYEAYLVRLDKNNTVLWNKIYGQGDEDGVFAVTQTRDKGFVAAGQTTSAMTKDVNAYVIKTDSQGNLLWQKSFGGSDKEDAHSLIELADGNLLFSGYTYSKGEGGDAYIVKISSKGDMIWEKNYGSESREDLFSVKELPNGHIVGIGIGGKNNDIYAIELDARGNLVQEKYIGDEYMEQGNDIEIAPAGGYFICGFKATNSTNYVYMYIAKLNKNFEKEWDKIYPGESFSVAFGAVAEKDGSFTISGTTKNWGKIQNDDGILFNVSAQGETNWEEIFGDEDIEYINSLEKDAQGYYYMTGYVVHASGPRESTYDINYVKYKHQGE